MVAAGSQELGEARWPLAGPARGEEERARPTGEEGGKELRGASGWEKWRVQPVRGEKPRTDRRSGIAVCVTPFGLCGAGDGGNEAEVRHDFFLLFFVWTQSIVSFCLS